MWKKFQRCRGLRLLRIGRWQAELWFAPAGEKVPPHVHDRIDSRIYFLGGGMTFRRRRASVIRTAELGWRNIGENYSVRAGETHDFKVTGRFGLFLNVEHWHAGEITSAAVDFRVSA